jgi:hypothetical protein
MTLVWILGHRLASGVWYRLYGFSVRANVVNAKSRRRKQLKGTGQVEEIPRLIEQRTILSNRKLLA